MTLKIASLLLSILAIISLSLIACGNDESGYEAMSSEPAFAKGAFGMADVETEESFDAPMMAQEAPMPPPRPEAPAFKSLQAEVESSEQSFRDETGGISNAQLVSQNRIIVRTVSMSLQVTDVAVSLDQVAALAVEFGGWVVDTNRSERHRGRITVRVPADRLDETVLQLRKSAIEVKSELSTSQDVTDEYFDATARLSSLQVERDALRQLFDEATGVDEALKVRESLSRIQGDIEVLQAQIKRIEKTSAYSLITVNLEAKPSKMMVDAGQDHTAGVGEPVRFRATFKPPKGVDDFLFTWDFGDGEWVVTSDRTAPTEDPDTRVTATVTHQYSDERDSPYFAEVKISGTGDSGLAEGEDTMIVTVTRVPTIEVFAGDSITAVEGDVVQFGGSFTRPEGISDVEFTWDFGDGSPPTTGSLTEGVTVAVAEHTYKNFRPFSYRATLTITSTSEAGDSKGTGWVNIQVKEAEGWIISGWRTADQVKSAVRSLTAVVKFALNGLLWIAILSPAWGTLVAVGYFGWRFRPFRKKKKPSSG